MSLTSKQIDDLRSYAADRKGDLAKLINDDSDTIEMLSAKLHASQMERSSQYYHGGWIPCIERLPGKEDYYLTTTIYKEVYCDYWNGENFDRTEIVIAWMPLPEPYREESDGFENAPTIEPERKKGKWIKVNGKTAINCSACYHCSWSLSFEDTVKRFNFCPNCGADMRGEQDE